jgi:hypothetical protein
VLNPSALAILIPRPPPFARCLTRTLMPRSSIRTTRADPSATSWHHILDVDRSSSTTASAASSARTDLLSAHRPSRPVDERKLLSRDVAGIIDEFARLRPAEVEAIRALTSDQLARPGDHDEAGEITVSDLVHQWAYYDLMHLKQAQSIPQAPLVARMGNTRKFYDL